MKRSLVGMVGLGLALLLSQASCGTAEHEAAAAEVDVLRETCSLGEMTTVSRCGGVEASCHVCGRAATDEAMCRQPCTVGKYECPGSQRCVPVDNLAGYARIGDCPTGYCE